MKTENIVQKETKNIAVGVLVLSALMLLVYLVLGRFHLSVLLSAFVGGTLAVLNFFMLGKSLQKAVKKDESDVRKFVKLSYTYRMMGLFIILVICMYSGFFHPVALLVPLIFPRITISILNLFRRKEVEENA